MKRWKMLFPLISLCLGLSACAKTPQETPNPLPDPTETVNYTVRAAYPGGEPVGGIEIELVPQSEISEKIENKKRTDGNGAAKFTLPAAVYSVRIDENQENFPAGYAFDNGQYSVSPSSSSVSVKLTLKGEPLLSFDEKYRGNWIELTSGEAQFNLSVSEKTLYFNGEEASAFRDENGFWFLHESVVYRVKTHELLEGALTLSFQDSLIVLLPKDGLDRAELPAFYDGTWTTLSGDEEISFTLIGSTFTFRGTDGYIASYSRDDEKATLIAVHGDSVYVLTHDLERDTIEIEGIQADFPFSKTGAGVAGDPLVLEKFVEEGKDETIYEYPLRVAVNETSFGSYSYSYNSVYLSYTTGNAQETYTLIPIFEQMSFRVQTEKAVAEESYETVAEWNAQNANTRYCTFVLEANETYIIEINNSTPIGIPGKELPPCTITFAIARGKVDPPKEVPVPAKYAGTWYNEADKTNVVQILASRIRWNSREAEIQSADEEKIEVIANGVLWTLRLDNVTLRAESETQSASFTLLSGEKPYVVDQYEGLWVTSEGDYLYCESVPGRGRTIRFMGKETTLVSGDLNGLILLTEDEIWRSSTILEGRITFTGSKGGVKVFQMANEITSFSESVCGEYEGEGLSLSVDASSFRFNQNAVKVYSVNGNLTFCTQDKVYSLKIQDGSYVLAELLSGEEITLSKKA